MTDATNTPARSTRWSGLVAFAVLPALGLLIGAQSADRPAAVEAAPVEVIAVRAEAQAVAEWSELLADAAVPAAFVVAPAVQPAFRTIRMEVTAYCACTHCCGPNAQGLTASGLTVDYNDGRFVAADTRVLPFGTKLVIPGYADDQAVEVQDRGGAIKGGKLDLYFATHEEALQWGRQHLDVIVMD